MSLVKTVRIWLAASLMVVSVGGATMSLVAPATVLADAKCDKSFLTIPPWYRGLTNDKCDIVSPGDSTEQLNTFIWTIVLNVIEILLHLVGYVTIFFIILGGFKYMTAAGSSDGMAKAKTTIMNAVIGLVLSIVSIAIVNVVAGAIQ